MMDFRNTDGLLAVATYGAGMFTSIINSTKDKTTVKQIWMNNISLYPNPIVDELYVDMYNHNALDASYKIYDLKGKIVAEGIFEKVIYTKDLSPGIYFIRLNIDDKMVTKKIVKF